MWGRRAGRKADRPPAAPAGRGCTASHAAQFARRAAAQQPQPEVALIYVAEAGPDGPGATGQARSLSAQKVANARHSSMLPMPRFSSLRNSSPRLNTSMTGSSAASAGRAADLSRAHAAPGRALTTELPQGGQPQIRQAKVFVKLLQVLENKPVYPEVYILKYKFHLNCRPCGSCATGSRAEPAAGETFSGRPPSAMSRRDRRHSVFEQTLK